MFLLCCLNGFFKALLSSSALQNEVWSIWMPQFFTVWWQAMDDEGKEKLIFQNAKILWKEKYFKLLFINHSPWRLWCSFFYSFQSNMQQEHIFFPLFIACFPMLPSVDIYNNCRCFFLSVPSTLPSLHLSLTLSLPSTPPPHLLSLRKGSRWVCGARRTGGSGWGLRSLWMTLDQPAWASVWRGTSPGRRGLIWASS